MENLEPNPVLVFFRQLRETSESLRAALVARDVDGILQAVQTQEQLVSDYRRQHAPRIPAARTRMQESPPTTTRELHALMTDIQRLQHINHRVAATFLEAVDHTLTSLGVGAPRRRVTYGVDGWKRASSTPVFFQQRG